MDSPFFLQPIEPVLPPAPTVPEPPDGALNHLAAAIDAPLLIVGHDWHIRFLNARAAHALTGSDGPAQALVGVNLLDLVPPDLVERVAPALKSLLTWPRNGIVELVNPRDQRWYTLQIIRQPDGVAFLGMDITATKLVEQALRRTNASLARTQATFRATINRLHHVLHTTQAGVWELDCRTCLFAWDDTMYRLFGLEPPAAHGVAVPMPWEGYIYRADCARVAHAIDVWITGRVPGPLTFRVHPRGGDERWLRMAGHAAYNEDGQVVRITGLCTIIPAEQAWQLGDHAE